MSSFLLQGLALAEEEEEEGGGEEEEEEEESDSLSVVAFPNHGGILCTHACCIHLLSPFAVLRGKL